MKRFIFKCIAYTLIVVLVCWLLLLISPKDPDHYLAEYDVKMQMLANPERGASVILLGGSGTAFGFNSEIIEQETGLPVINAGLHAGLSQRFILDDIVPYLHPDDLLVFSPEHTSFHNGGDVLGYLILYSNCLHYSSFSIGNWLSIIRNLPTLLSSQYRLIGQHPHSCPPYSRSSFNRFGDVTWHWYNDVHSACSNVSECRAYRHTERRNMHYVCHTLQSLPCSLILLPSPINESLFSLSRCQLKEMDSVFESHQLHFLLPLT